MELEFQEEARWRSPAYLAERLHMDNVGNVFRGWHVFLAVVVVIVLGKTLPAATAASGEDKLASAIEKRLNSLGITTTPITRGEGYFPHDRVLPQGAFFAYAGCRQPFRFTVFVYRTPAQATTMYEYFHQYVVNIGGDFHAFNMVRSGRVIYLGSTSPGPDRTAPSIPSRDFRSLAAGVNGQLPLNRRACRPKSSDL